MRGCFSIEYAYEIITVTSSWARCVSNHRRLDCLLNRLLRLRSMKTSKSASLTFVREIHRSPVNSPHEGPVTRKMFPFGDVVMIILQLKSLNIAVAHNLFLSYQYFWNIAQRATVIVVTLSKIEKWFDNFNGCYVRTKFPAIWIKDEL